MCQGVNKATIARDEWQAVKPRYVQPVAGIANEVILWHTGPDTCRMIGLSSYNCEKCIQNEACIKKHLSAFQDTDLSKFILQNKCSNKIYFVVSVVIVVVNAVVNIMILIKIIIVVKLITKKQQDK